MCISSCNLENLFLSEIQIGWWINAEIIDRFIAWLDYFCELNMNNIQIHEMISLPLSPTPQLIPWPFCTVIQFIQFNRISTVALITFILTVPPRLVCRYLHLHWTNCLAQTETQELAMQRVCDCLSVRQKLVCSQLSPILKNTVLYCQNQNFFIL